MISLFQKRVQKYNFFLQKKSFRLKFEIILAENFINSYIFSYFSTYQKEFCCTYRSI